MHPISSGLLERLVSKLVSLVTTTVRGLITMGTYQESSGAKPRSIDIFLEMIVEILTERTDVYLRHSSKHYEIRLINSELILLLLPLIVHAIRINRRIWLYFGFPLYFETEA